MESKTAKKREWVFYGRWTLVPSIMGISILVFVVASGIRHAWLLWIAVPMIMFGLGSMFILNAIAALVSIGERSDEVEGEGKGDGA